MLSQSLVVQLHSNLPVDDVFSLLQAISRLPGVESVVVIAEMIRDPFPETSISTGG